MSLIISFCFFSLTAFCVEQENLDNASITDFTIYKITPQKTTSTEIPLIDSEQQNKTVQKSTPAQTKHVNKIELKTITQQNNIEKTANQPEVFQKKKLPEKKSAINHIQIKKEPVIKPEIKTEKNPEFNKNNYADNLNTYLNNEKIYENSVKNEPVQKLNNLDYFVKPSVSLGIVLFLILALAWIYGKIKGITPNTLFMNAFGEQNINKFKILSTSSLGQGKIIQLVEINGKQLVVGSTNNNINLLTEISAEDVEILKTKIDKNKDLNKKEEENPEKEDEREYFDPENYTAQYSELYKDYIEKKNKA